MTIPARHKWINKNKRRGDITTVAKLLALKTSTVRDVVNGKFSGEHGEKILLEMENIIDNRIKQAIKLQRKYTTKLKLKK